MAPRNEQCPPAEAEGHIWSGRRGSNSRPQPWQGCALPAELRPQRRRTLVHRARPTPIMHRRVRRLSVHPGEPPARLAGSPDPAGPAEATAGRQAGDRHPLPRPTDRPGDLDVDGEPPPVAHRRPSGHPPAAGTPGIGLEVVTIAESLTGWSGGETRRGTVGVWGVARCTGGRVSASAKGRSG
jgi:hypothetical protein